MSLSFFTSLIIYHDYELSNIACTCLDTLKLFSCELNEASFQN